MRNLKRVLSLTLASVMLLGMMVIGASAAQGYDDVDDTYNVEAIEVLQAINVMAGDAGTGNFRPDSAVTRGEMARIMAALLDLDYNYYSTTGIHPFNDTVGHWAEPYAAACKANGIIAGRTDTTFDPDAYVTAIEASSMMMRALGYFKYPSDYAAGFEVATVTQGTKINLYDGVGSSAVEPMTRNQVAQLALNTLEADLVEAQDNTLSINGAGISITGGQVNYVVRTTNASWAGAIDGKLVTSSNSSADGRWGYIIQLGEQLYNGNLKKFEGRDVFGNPANTWEYKNDIIGTYAWDATAEYTSSVKEGALFTLIGRNNFDRIWNQNSAVLRVKIDGVDQGTGTGNAVVGQGTGDTRSDIMSYIESNSSRNATGTGNGTLTKVYIYDDDDYNLRVDISIVHTWVAQVTDEYNSTKGTLSIDVLGTTPFDPAKDPDKGFANYYPTVSELNGNEFEGLDKFAIDDYILFTYDFSANSNLGSVETIQPATLMTGTVTRYDTAGDNVYINGNKTDYNWSLKGDDKPDFNLGTDATFVMDDYGYVIWVDDNSVSQDYLFVYGMISNTGFTNQAQARVIFSDGTMDEITVEKLTVHYRNRVNSTGGMETLSNKGPNKDQTWVTTNSAYLKNDADLYNDGWTDPKDEFKTDSTKDTFEVVFTGLPTTVDATNGFGALQTRYEIPDKTAGGDPNQFNGWYSYSEDNGKYTLTQVWTDQLVTADQAKGNKDGDPYTLKGKTPTYAGSAPLAPANNNTIFFLLDGDEVTVYNGVSNLPDITLRTTGGAKGAAKTLDDLSKKYDFIGSMLYKDGKNSSYAGLVVIASEEPTIDGGTENLLYIVRNSDKYSEKNGQVIYEYVAVINGKETKILTKGEEFKAKDTYYRYTVTSDGYYKAGTKWTDWPADATVKPKHVDDSISGYNNSANDLITAKGDALTIKGTNGLPDYIIASDAKITLILVNKDDGDNAMLNDGVRYQVRENIKLSSLAAADNGYTNIDLKWYGIATSDNGRVLETLYVIIDKATKQ